VQLQRDVKIDKLSHDSYVEQSLEILAALRKLGDTLQPDEDAFLASHATDSLRLFEKVDHEQLGEIGLLSDMQKTPQLDFSQNKISFCRLP